MMWWVQAILTGLGPSLAGGLVGLVLGNLRWPLVLALLEGNATLAAGTNLAVSTLAAAGGTAKHARDGRVDVALLVRLGGAAVVGGLVGSFLTRALPRAVLLGLIAALLLSEGTRMLLRAASAPPEVPVTQGARRRYLAEITIGFVIGVLSGMVGMLLGSLRLPAMIRWLGVDARKAVGTNMAIGLAQGLAATAGHLWQGQVALTPLAVVGAAALVGAYVGAHFSGRLPVPILKRAIGVVLLVSGAALVAAQWS